MKVQGTQRARRVKKAGYTPKNVRADLEAIVDAAASRVRERYILWRKMFEERQTGVPSDYEPGPQWDGGLDAAGQTHPPIWPRIAKVLLAREFDVDAYIQAAFTLCEGGQPLWPSTLVSWIVLDNYVPQTDRDVADLSLALTLQEDALSSGNYWYGELDDHLSREQKLNAALLDETMSMTALFRYCVAHREQLESVCNYYRLEALAQYVAHSKGYDRVWGSLLPEDLRRNGVELRRMLVQ